LCDVTAVRPREIFFLVSLSGCSIGLVHQPSFVVKVLVIASTCVTRPLCHFSVLSPLLVKVSAATKPSRERMATTVQFRGH